METPRVSVIIPTYNEETYLPKLLDCLDRQTWPELEVIVADNHSTDRTREIAREHGARIVDGGMPGPGRNRGGEAATGDYLFFFDSDVKVAQDFVKKAVREMQKREAELATCETLPLSSLALDQFMHKAANLFVRLNLESDPHAPGFCILCSRRVWEATGGFDESLKLAEDHDFVKRAAEHAPLAFLESVRVTVSVRRYRKEGRLDYMRKVVEVTAYRARHGEIREDTFNYEFGDFDRIDDSKLRSLERQINKLDMKVKHARRQMIRQFKKINNSQIVQEFSDGFEDAVQGIKDLFSSDRTEK